jgi:hypothetical protein
MFCASSAGTYGENVRGCVRGDYLTESGVGANCASAAVTLTVAQRTKVFARQILHRASRRMFLRLFVPRHFAIRRGCLETFADISHFSSSR